MLDSLLIALSSLFLEDDLHAALCVFDHGGLDPDMVGRDDGIAAEGVFTGADLVDLLEVEDVADFYVFETRDGEEVAWGEGVFSAGERGDDVVGGLGAEEGECGGGGGCWRCGQGMQGPGGYLAQSCNRGLVDARCEEEMETYGRASRKWRKRWREPWPLSKVGVLQRSS